MQNAVVADKNVRIPALPEPVAITPVVPTNVIPVPGVKVTLPPPTFLITNLNAIPNANVGEAVLSTISEYNAVAVGNVSAFAPPAVIFMKPPINCAVVRVAGTVIVLIVNANKGLPFKKNWGLLGENVCVVFELPMHTLEIVVVPPFRVVPEPPISMREESVDDAPTVPAAPMTVHPVPATETVLVSPPIITVPLLDAVKELLTPPIPTVPFPLSVPDD